ncbi:hypothetical protein GLOIN_2v1785173 [Rhizophagus irregularis DAOM 181602=DAOM 197198]|uniref:Uncharacterized protein n=1 Tax=Rhizophagus irregularis (strain DAOM 181602 / DAOM 197198 / MUCL 43194) TaxID=747089 RepID=A0A2P4PAY2_RHIID|nr:hypothetical protein GLOIN_2v1785173 [Rhizophagus irregularis DAOM 181602=DAOM 197198]POG62559.1 hypothetical protein GLOIN_2v1785173 [Rhizophagus irregularis DAOM 181602=DAOM 197198]|eukprot:XP_025169425.1 hypothetical protein GLOIN_2v1785173 [Rhizophagus irregularis DAOM 181602=DAOM 197198]
MVLIFLEETGSAFRWASEVQKLQRFVWLSGGLPKYRNSKDSWKLWKNLNIFVLAQLVSPCGRYLMNWPDLHYLRIVGRKGRIPNWFTFINNNFLSSSSSTLLLSSYFINSSFTLASLCLLDHTVKDYSFYPQWAITLDSATQTLSVGRVYITYKKQNSAIMSHWLPVST